MDKTFLKGLALLKTLARAERPLGVTELARDMQLTKSNVHRLLQTLIHAGLAQKNESTSLYEPTMQLWELGMHVVARLDVRQVAAPYMQDLARSTGETVHLSILQDEDVMYIDLIDSPHAVRTNSRVGQRVPAYCVATGKALLAWQPPEVIESVGRKIERFTELTVADTSALHEELARVRECGYGLNLGDYREMVVGVAAPIRDARGAVVSAIGLSGPAERLKRQTLVDLAPTLIAAADSVSLSLGYRPPLPR